eukprot:TRINITY_DN4479_c0_g1_i2.p1 TRINITY_DN4479_c0_g1~~TRINITY_DN4479_c0_g1_i2.p1  ORF type:complete len:723 (+),score=177.40 TRINITY_DN4479_c0_g1_i2:93-2261(+)
MVDVSIVQLLFNPNEESDRFLFDDGGQLEEDYQQYLADLASYSLEQLAKEPDTLRMELNSAKTRLEELASRNYKSFVRTYETVIGVHQGMVQVGSCLDSLMQHIPSLVSQSKSFETNAKALSQARRTNQVTLQHYTQLIELLEIPQLMENFVKNKLYDEALELISFAQRLTTLHPDIQLITNLVAEVFLSSKSMQEQLVSELQSSSQLPVCLRVVGYLRRLAVYSELELRMCFLKSRDCWFNNILAKIPTEDPYTFLSKMVDVCRVHLFEIITHYRAIFAEDTSDSEEAFREAGILYSWVNDKIQSFLETLKSTLPRISDGGYISNILEQCMYYGDSLGRTSIDFRGLLPPVFENAVMKMFAGQMSHAIIVLRQSLENTRWLSSSSFQYPVSLPTEENDMSPPTSLMQYQPLALFTNELLNAFNELRQCALLSIQHQLGQTLCATLIELAEKLEQFKEQISGQESDEATFSGMCKATVEVFLPYILRCFDSVFASHRPLVDKRLLIEKFATLHKVEVLEISSMYTAAVHSRSRDDAGDGEEEDLVDATLRETEDVNLQENGQMGDISADPDAQVDNEENKTQQYLDSKTVVGGMDTIQVDIMSPEATQVTVAINIEAPTPSMETTPEEADRDHEMDQQGDTGNAQESRDVSRDDGNVVESQAVGTDEQTDQIAGGSLLQTALQEQEQDTNEWKDDGWGDDGWGEEEDDGQNDNEDDLDAKDD